jgi:hypothetical protein
LLLNMRFFGKKYCWICHFRPLMLRNGSAPCLLCWVRHEAGGLAWHHTQHNGQGIWPFHGM